jgi:hypothetical protein
MYKLYTITKEKTGVVGFGKVKRLKKSQGQQTNSDTKEN